MSSSFVDLSTSLPKFPWQRIRTLNTRRRERMIAYHLAYKTLAPSIYQFDDFTSYAYEIAPSTLATYVHDPSEFVHEWDPYSEGNHDCYIRGVNNGSYPWSSWWDIFVLITGRDPTQAEFEAAMHNDQPISGQPYPERFYAGWFALVMCRMFQLKVALCINRHFTLAKDIAWVDDPS